MNDDIDKKMFTFVSIIYNTFSNKKIVCFFEFQKVAERDIVVNDGVT